MYVYGVDTDMGFFKYKIASWKFESLPQEIKLVK